MTIHKFDLPNEPFANGATASEIAPFPDYERGLGIAFDQTEGKPEMKGLNGLFNAITEALLYLRQRGIGEWSSTIEYPKGYFAVEGESLYQAKETNTGKQPSLSQSQWRKRLDLSDMLVSTNGNLKKTVNSDGSVMLEVPTASNSQRGAMRFATNAEVVNQSSVQAAIQPSDVQSMFSGVKSPNGWTKLPNGMILQWGTTDYSSRPAETNVTVNFPTAFPLACLNVGLTRKVIATTLQNDGGALLVSQTRTNFIVNLAHFSDSNEGLRGFTWFAIGY